MVQPLFRLKSGNKTPCCTPQTPETICLLNEQLIFQAPLNTNETIAFLSLLVKIHTSFWTVASTFSRSVCKKKNNNFRLYIFRIWLCLIFNENRSYNIQCIFFVFKVREFPPSPSLWNKQKHVETFRFGELFWIWYKTRGIFVFRFAQKPLNLGLEKKSLGNL